MANLKFSILIPNLHYNQTLFECLDSVVAQKRSATAYDVEIILCDQSDDVEFRLIEREIINRYFAHEILLIHSQTKGLLRARHTLMAKASGDYICFVDSDDFVTDDYLKTIFNFLSSNHCPDIFVFSFYLVRADDGLRLNARSFPNDIQNHIQDYFDYSSFLNGAWYKCFKKDLYSLEDYTNFEIVNGEDWVFSLPLMKKAKQISIASDAFLYCYRQNPNSLTHSFSFETAVNQLNYRNDYLSRHKVSSRFQSGLYMDFLLSSYCNGATHLLKNKKISFRLLAKYSNEANRNIETFDNIRDLSKFSPKKKIIYYLLRLRLYVVLFWVFKILNN